LAHEQGYCVIIVTHDPSIAERSDKVWHMSDGVLIEEQLAGSERVFAEQPRGAAQVA
jgi:ABC-type lipoprotein export system ATPase subunit